MSIITLGFGNAKTMQIAATAPCSLSSGLSGRNGRISPGDSESERYSFWSGNLAHHRA
jgi:hypothetical protein